ncbi:MAG: hypothetical protein RLZZ156_539 [Deinococcota bacterium]|jgi:hypothetical protein
MQPTLSFSRPLDNHHRGSVGAFLKEKIHPEVTLSFVSAYFTIYAYNALKPQLENIEQMRFLFGEPNFIKSIDPKTGKPPAAKIEQDQMSLEQTLFQSRIAKNCADWMRRKVEIRSMVKPGFLHGKAYLIEQGDYKRAVLGSSNFTVSGLALGKNSNIELNLEVTDDRDREDLKQWFDEIWADTSLTEDVKASVLKQLERLYVPNAPQFVYFKTLYHLFAGFTENQQSELKIPQRLMDSSIWAALYPFQRDGVKTAIRKLQTLGGCILADSVGLGKTYTTLAVIK